MEDLIFWIDDFVSSKYEIKYIIIIKKNKND
jgi:hypothetical protein